MTDATEDGRSLEARRELVRELSHALRPLHRLLIDLARADYEREHGPIPGPVALHGLLISNPEFAWLYPLLARMAYLDDLTDDDELLVATPLALVRRETEALLLGEEGERGAFATRYVELLHARPEVVIEHLTVRRVLDRM